MLPHKIHVLLESDLIGVVVDLIAEDQRYGYARSDEVVAFIMQKLDGTRSNGDFTFDLTLRREYEEAVALMGGKMGFKNLLKAVYHYQHREQRFNSGCLFTDCLGGGSA